MTHVPAEAAGNTKIAAEGIKFGTKWLKGIFNKLGDIFTGEIKEYEGTVAMYLAEKSQHLRVPERIFPIWWRMCKHVAAALYGVGVRLDEDPFLMLQENSLKET